MLGWIPNCAMIYDPTEISDPIRQGDIFTGVARAEIDLSELPIVTEDKILLQSWLDVPTMLKLLLVFVRLRG
jgi:hypothetical protein